MHDVSSHLMRTINVQARVGHLFCHRARHSSAEFMAHIRSAATKSVPLFSNPPWQIAQAWQEYFVDSLQRGVLFADTMRRRGNQFLAHELAGKPPVLHFEYELVLDGRKFERPVNYALLRITPPPGVSVDDRRRPYVIIDPRAGHGPGIGGFKDDSQVGVALRAGHPVYFVVFFPEPEPGQGMLDVCAAEQKFVHHVTELHPNSPKPVLVGNCQGGWAAMMVAAASPDDTGAIVISGAPMSYWGGAWTEGAGNNPMRYSGGLLGGTWLASFAADLGNGLFDGAHLAMNFESLDLANTYWDKYYHVYANADTEPPRFLDFERWWGGYFLMNSSEIEWITGNLFVGNDLWKGGEKVGAMQLDLRKVRAPLIMFASLGDNITPPQQAFNWVADTYSSTEEIKANGQVIIGLMHQKAGHLALFVSGKVAKREHAQIVSVLKSIEALPPGLYGMKIDESRHNGTTEYEVSFIEHRLEDISARLNRFNRADERPFATVEMISELNQRAYELFARPLVQACVNDGLAQLGREFHPLRVQHWALSDLNPCLWWLAPACERVKAERQPASADNPFKKAEGGLSELISASLDAFRDVRDAAAEALFFAVYGNLFFMYGDARRAGQATAMPTDPRAQPLVKDALAALEAGGYSAALARTAALLERRGAPVPLSRIERKAALMKEYAQLLPELAPHEWKLLRGQQEAIVKFEPERALSSLPRLLAEPADRDRFLQLLERLTHDREFVQEPSPAQYDMLRRIKELLGGPERQLATAIAVHASA